MIRLISIDDHKLFSDGLWAIISKEKDMVLLQGYRDGDNIAAILSTHRPDIVLLDMYLPRKSGLSIAKEIKETYPQIKVIILSLEVNSVFVAELETLGVEGYLSKELDAKELLSVIRKVYGGERVYEDNVMTPSSMRKVLMEDFGLTKRELEVYQYIRNGKSSQEIAKMLNRSVMTIMTHRKNIRQKIRTSIRHHDGLFEDDVLNDLLKEE